MRKTSIKKKAFTLIELIIVIIIVGILASLGVTQYTKVVEKGREAEALMVLSTLRTLQNEYYLENGTYTNSMNTDPNLPLLAGCNQTTHFYSYSCSGSDVDAGCCYAYRCFAPTGKNPGYVGTTAPSIRLCPSGILHRSTYSHS